MSSVINQTNMESNIEVNDYESWEQRVDDDDTLSTMSDEGVGEESDGEEVPSSLGATIAGAEVDESNFPLPGVNVVVPPPPPPDLRWAGFSKKAVKETFSVGSSRIAELRRPMVRGDVNDARSKAFEKLEDRKKSAPSLLKTRMCRSTETGEKCPHGDRCRFAHTVEELRISECFFGDRCRFVRRHRTQEGVYFNNSGKFCNHLHPGESRECYYKRTGKEMPVVVPPKEVEKEEEVPVKVGRNPWVPKTKLAYKQPTAAEIEAMQAKRIAELAREKSEADVLADELQEIIDEAVKGVDKAEVCEAAVCEPELVLRVPESGYMAALEMAMRSGRSNVRVEIVGS